VIDYGLDDWSMNPSGGWEFFPHCVQTGSGAHPASYPVDTRDSFPGGKAARA